MYDVAIDIRLLILGLSAMMFGNALVLRAVNRRAVMAAAPLVTQTIAPPPAPIAPDTAKIVPSADDWTSTATPIPCPRFMTPQQAAKTFLACLIDDCDRTGWIAAETIDSYWQWLCDRDGIEHFAPDILREHLRAMPGVRYRASARLMTPEFSRVRYETGAARRAVYWLPSSLEAALFLRHRRRCA